MFAAYRKLANIWTFLIVFCLCFFLETITFTYLISAIQSIERQFEIPSSKSGTLVSAGDIGYILFVVILAYYGSKGNRARWIGAGCLLISFACLLIALPHFIFKEPPALALKGEIVTEVMKPPEYLTWKNVTVKDLLDFPPIKKKVPGIARDMLLEKAGYKVEGGGGLFGFGSNDDYDDYYANYEDDDAEEGKTRVKRFAPPMEMTPEEKAEAAKFKKTFEDVIMDRANISVLIAMVQKKIQQPPPAHMIMRIQRAVGLPFGHCNRIVNTLKNRLEELKCVDKSPNTAAYGMVFLGILLIGIGHSMPWSLGVPLIDDNVKKRSVPFYFAFIFFIRILGPILGFVIGGACTKLYYNFDAPEGLTFMDPRWIGAWWLGYVIIFAALLLPALLLFCFPDTPKTEEPVGPQDEEFQLKEGQNRANGEKKTQQLHLSDKHRKGSGDKPSISSEIKSFFVALLIVLKCPVYTGALIGRLFDTFAFKGFFVFLPKYIESHYGIPLFKANFLMGVMGVPGFALGVALGSIIMRKLKLEGRRAAFYIGLISLVSALISFINLGLGCTSVVNMVGEAGKSVNYNYSTECNSDCSCETASLFPVCSENGTAYYSPCHAGCKNMTIVDKRSFKIEFRECDCIDVGSMVKRDWCQDNCHTNMIIYFTIMVLGGLIGGTSVIPSILVVLRSVPPEHRSVALGFSGFIISLLSTFPSPIVFGFIVDSACDVWNVVCGVQGSCKIYDPTKLRTKMYSFNAGLRVAALVMDVWVWYWAKGLKLMEEEPDAPLAVPIEHGKDRKLSAIEAMSAENIANGEMKI